jgi:hypothetical protein
MNPYDSVTPYPMAPSDHPYLPEGIDFVDSLI